MKHGNAFSRISSGLLVAGLFLAMNSFPASADENVSVHGTAVAELSAGWWQWQEAFYPDSDFGEDDVDCSLGQSGPVWYLGGSFSPDPVVRTCDGSIKGHKHLMFPLINAAMFNPDEWCELMFDSSYCTVEEKREILNGLLSEDPAGIFNTEACLLKAEVDGNPAVYSASIVRTQSPPFAYASDTEAVADGIWVVLSPLSPGNHTVHFEGGLCDLASGDPIFSTSITYNLTVQPNR